MRLDNEAEVIEEELDLVQNPKKLKGQTHDRSVRSSVQFDPEDLGGEDHLKDDDDNEEFGN